MSSRHPKSLVLFAVCVAWLALVLSGSAALWRYKQTPGADLLAPSDWPAASKIRRPADRPTLLIFIHPRCACSRATISELERLVTRAQGLMDTRIYMFRPQGSTADWVRGELWRTAAAIPGVSVYEDEGGAEARLFHGETSGHTVLYDAKGSRLFDGGITASRGHEGDSAGQAALLALLHKQSSKDWHTEIFGCRIRNRTDGTLCGDKPCAR